MIDKNVLTTIPGHYSLSRREWFALMGGAFAASLIGCSGGGGPFDNSPYTKQIIAGCVVSPEQTEGPYFVDEKLNRSDIRLDPADGSITPGVPLNLTINVLQIANNACNPLPGATVDIWHCDARGAYSDVKDNTGEFADTRGQKFLRGCQLTDSNGKVQFRTIYPGWYHGRTVHIHFMVRTDPKSEVGHEFTSQLYFDEAISDQVYALAPYAAKGQRDTVNDRDGIFKRGGGKLMLQLSPNGEGYTAAYNVGLLY